MKISSAVTLTDETRAWLEALPVSEDDLAEDETEATGIPGALVEK